MLVWGIQQELVLEQYIINKERREYLFPPPKSIYKIFILNFNSSIVRFNNTKITTLINKINLWKYFSRILF